MSLRSWLQLLPNELKAELACYWYRNQPAQQLANIKRERDEIFDTRRRLTKKLRRINNLERRWNEEIPEVVELKFGTDQYWAVHAHFKNKLSLL